MNLIFVSDGSYPDQGAAAIRHTTLAKGLVANGHDVLFLILSSQKWGGELEDDGVRFKCLNEYRGYNKLLKLIYYAISLVRLVFEVQSYKNEKYIDGIVSFSRKNSILQTIILISKVWNIKSYHERTELPYIVGKSNSLVGKLKYDYYLKCLIPRFHGIFVITDKLEAFFKPYNENIKKILTVVDLNFFSSMDAQTPQYKFPYIAYCGTMKGQKDGVPTLIQSFSLLKKDFPDYKLLLIGNDSEENTRDVRKQIDKLSLHDSVKFTGFVARKEMPQLLVNADLLVVSKLDVEQNSGNFPIKVGEYLSTGVPTVLTKVGEIPKFLKDMETSYLAEPNSADDFYKKMKEALENYKIAMEIGKNGQKLAQRLFDYKIQAQEMASFMEER
jgi:glycosyltransferase involved in cell wall biosynthesis